MGHQDIRTTMIYAHYAPSEQEVAIVNAAFSAAAGMGVQFGVQTEGN